MDGNERRPLGVSNRSGRRQRDRPPPPAAAEDMIDDSPSIKLFRFHELWPTSTDLSDLRVELGLIGPSRTCMHRSSSTGLLNLCRCRLLLGWAVQANTCVHSRLH